MGRFQNIILIGNLVLMIVLVWAIFRLMPELAAWRANRDAPPKKLPEEFSWVDPARGLKINMFYASPGLVTEGTSASLCYGVSNARKLRLEPPVAEVSPSLNRCVQVWPEKQTRYTLVAEDEYGGKATETLELRVIPDPDRAPKITYFRVDRSRLKNGESEHLLCFSTWNAEEVEVQPPAFPKWKVLQGCFFAVPKEKTTYTLTAYGTHGRRVQRVLEVGPIAGK